MRNLVTVLMISSLGLAGCSGFRDSGANPANWFGRSSTIQHPVTADGSNPLIPEASNSILSRRPSIENYPGTPIYAVQAIEITPSSGGAILKATGVALRQGAYDVRLVPENRGMPVNGVLSFSMQAIQPQNTPQGSERTRRVSAGKFISAQTLEQVQELRVLSEVGTATSRR